MTVRLITVTDDLCGMSTRDVEGVAHRTPRYTCPVSGGRSAILDENGDAVLCHERSAPADAAEAAVVAALSAGIAVGKRVTRVVWSPPALPFFQAVAGDGPGALFWCPWRESNPRRRP